MSIRLTERAAAALLAGNGQATPHAPEGADPVLQVGGKRKTAPSTVRGQKRGSGPEQAIQNAILAYLQACGILAWRINSGAVKTATGGLVKLAPKGHPDIAGVLPGGRALYIEVKTPTGKLSADQAAFLERLQCAGAVAFVARSIDDVEITIARHL